MDMRKVLSVPIFLACAPSVVGQTVDRLSGQQAGALPEHLDLHVDQPERIEVRGTKPRFLAAPLPGHSPMEGPSALAIYDSKTGASIGEFGWAYFVAAPP